MSSIAVYHILLLSIVIVNDSIAQSQPETVFPYERRESVAMPSCASICVSVDSAEESVTGTDAARADLLASVGAGFSFSAGLFAFAFALEWLCRRG